MFAAHAYSGAPAKVPGVLCRIRGAGNRDFSFCGSGLSSPDAAYRRLRGHAGLGVRQHVTAGDVAQGFGLRSFVAPRCCATGLADRWSEDFAYLKIAVRISPSRFLACGNRDLIDECETQQCSSLYVGIVYRPQIYRGILPGWFYDSAGIARDRDHWINENCLIARKARERTSGFYFSAAAGLGLAFAAGLAADLAGACKDARRARVLTRLAAWDRLRVFLRALVFGMGSSLSVWYILR